MSHFFTWFFGLTLFLFEKLPKRHCLGYILFLDSSLWFFCALFMSGIWRFPKKVSLTHYFWNNIQLFCRCLRLYFFFSFLNWVNFLFFGRRSLHIIAVKRRIAWYSNGWSLLSLGVLEFWLWLCFEAKQLFLNLLQFRLDIIKRWFLYSIGMKMGNLVIQVLFQMLFSTRFIHL